MKIFWAWQSDTLGKTGRVFVRDALLEAVNVLKQADEIEEPTRAEAREKMHVDQDRQGVTGSPALADTIKLKIREAAVFIGDVTPVSRIAKRQGVKDSREKRNMNPNVAIELGYAQHALGDEQVLMVLNEHYGGREFLPFDLQHHAGPIIYSLKPDASKEEVVAEQAKLRGHFVSALRGFLDASATETLSTFPAIPFTTTNAVWFDPGEVLADFKEDDTRYAFDDDRGAYLKILPRFALPQPLTTSEVFNLARQRPPGILYRQQSAGVKGYSLVIDTTIDNPYEIRDDSMDDSFILSDTSPAGIDAALLQM